MQKGGHIAKVCRTSSSLSTSQIQSSEEPAQKIDTLKCFNAVEKIHVICSSVAANIASTASVLALLMYHLVLHLVNFQSTLFKALTIPLLVVNGSHNREQTWFCYIHINT
ncbi:uncharacterized protein LOC116416281 [Nasonia vitripennis]|uniref:Uncharacterized protein n=1 Tax=Nasonia vitripennis TaxID=7425 RepID=A0A7M7Q0F9_NASVI|nr:uncharacterized protein LOC116416281 [Nasonia vitripennis]